MTTPNTNITVVGTIDGKPPVYNPDGRFQWWRYDQIFFGEIGEGKYVPNVMDMVKDTTTFIEYWVVRVDEVTLIPELALAPRPVQTGDVDKEDLLIGVGPGGVSDTFRIYIDTSVIPHTMALDARCSLYGKDLRWYEICKGSELDGTLRVISANYDQSGNYLGTAIPLDLANMRDHTNECTWALPVCHTHEAMPDNDVVQVRAYSDTGGLRSKFPLLVENTAYIRLSDNSLKYVTDISLDSPFLSKADPNLLEYPLNVPLSGLNLFATVHYSDGSSLRLPVDGTKFEIFGFKNFIATIVGERTPLQLKYNFSRGEFHYGSTIVSDHFMMESYTAIATKEDGSYTVKLFGYPVWAGDTAGWAMEYYMYNLDRKQFTRVTPYVEYNANLPAFNPKLYGVNQEISVSINLNKVNPMFKDWIHVQVFDVVLYRHGTERVDTQWTVGFERGQTPVYGRENFAKVTFINANLKHIDITNGETKFANWLERFYWNTKPIFSDVNESKAPEPNMFILQTQHGDYEFPIAQWNSKLSVTSLLGNTETLFVRFIKRTIDSDLQLGIAAIPLLWMNSQP